MIKIMLTQLVNEKKRLGWTMGALLFIYSTTYKVSTRHIPFQLVYGLYPLMPTEYLVPTLT